MILQQYIQILNQYKTYSLQKSFQILLSQEQTGQLYPPDYNDKHQYKRNTDRDIDQDADKQYQFLIKPHIDSFNYFLTQGLENIVNCQQDGYTFTHQTIKQPINIKCIKLSFGQPTHVYNQVRIDLTPQICRDLSISYTVPLTGVFQFKQGETVVQVTQQLGQVPLMVGSRLCPLGKCKTQKDRIIIREDTRDFGGYFINNGGERLIRMLIQSKYNMITPLKRTAYLKRGGNFTEYGIQFRSLRKDMRSQTMVLHYLKDGSCVVRLLIDKKEYFIPIVYLLTALGATSQENIYKQVVYNRDETYISERILLQFQMANEAGIYTQNSALAYLGKYFRSVCYLHRNDLNDCQIGQLLLQEYVLFNLHENQQKIQILCQMLRRLYLLSSEKIQPENSDALSNQDVLVVGHLFTAYLSELIEETCKNASYAIIRYSKINQFDLTEQQIKKHNIISNGMIEQKFRSLVSTGNLNSVSGLDLLQQNSFSITADRLNFIRFLAHFRSIHRGAFFADMKSTSPRKQRPEQYGFICPVNSPDGASCGILNHIAQYAQVVAANQVCDEEIIINLLNEYGIKQLYSQEFNTPIVVNDRFLGFIPEQYAQYLFNLLHTIKSKYQQNFEVILIPQTSINQIPSLTVITSPARLCRLIQFNKKPLLISPYEQLYLDINVYEEHEEQEPSQYCEITPSSFLSVIAAGIIFLPYNQSPRNMYECQMLKQTMGITGLNVDSQFGSKIYRIYSPQKQLVTTQTYRRLALNSHPQGTNIVVAVLQYTAYDMEDACIINKSSLDRGLFYGTVYHTIEVNLGEMGSSSKLGTSLIFKSDGSIDGIDQDGQSFIGRVVTTGDIICQYYDQQTQKYRGIEYDNRETGIVDQILITRGQFIKQAMIARIRIRHDRTPIVGDKFASRSGQKGTLSLRYAGSRDMPFSMTSGITPDFIINSAAFPSRMTIGMLLDSVGCQICSLEGKQIIDGTAFNQTGDQLLDDVNQLLNKHQLNKYGTDILISPASSLPLQIPIFIGINYYQRLRHMVNDKYQARAKGNIDQITFQPIKGRSRGGAIRLGEMERDSLLGHGCSEIVMERYFQASDQIEREIDGKLVKIVGVDQVLISELAGMGIKLSLEVQ